MFSIKEDAEGYFIISHDSNIYSVRSLRTGEVYYHHSDYWMPAEFEPKKWGFMKVADKDFVNTELFIHNQV